MNSKEISIPSLLKIGPCKIEKIGKYLADRNFAKIAIFFSEGIENIVADKLYNGLNKYHIEVVHKNNISLINIEDATKTAFEIPTNINVLLGIGGGKAIDYAKYCAHLLNIPFISVATSVSNDGFASSNASLLVSNKRKSVKATIPYGVICDLDVIANAPNNTFYSGIGDIISKVTSIWDWKQAFLKGFEEVNDFAILMARTSLDIVTDVSNFNNKDFYYKMVNSLVLSGISMEIANSSRPASGSEHLISHALDMVSKTNKMHGIQVGIATYICSYLQNNKFETVKEFLTKSGFIDFIQEYRFDKQEFIEALKLAPTIKSNYYTILSEKDSFDKALSFINSDKILSKIII